MDRRGESQSPAGILKVGVIYPAKLHIVSALPEDSGRLCGAPFR